MRRALNESSARGNDMIQSASYLEVLELFAQSSMNLPMKEHENKLNVQDYNKLFIDNA